MATRKGKIIVSGILFWYPLAGVTFQFLHYLIGLRQLGFDPYYIEDLGRWIYDPRINDLSSDAVGNIGSIVPTLQAYGFGDRWAFRGRYPGGKCYGMTEQQLRETYAEADAFLNVTGGQELLDEHVPIKRRIYIESDPFALQIKVSEGDVATINMLAAYHRLFSFGENLGAPDCDVPIEMFRWLPTRQPVALELWHGPSRGGDTFNTITTWHNKGKDIVWRGRTWHWTKDREFQKFLDLPKRRSERFELAVTADEWTIASLRANGWRQTSSIQISGNLDRYRAYILQSRGEFTVAREQYVRPKTGWFSDRSACYLAAGRPVIAQETGFSKFLPTGRGLFSFKTMSDILNAVEAIKSDYEGNCRAAREIAAEFFSAEKVIGGLMDRVEP